MEIVSDDKHYICLGDEILSYSLAEKETIIRCDDETKQWTVYTIQSRVATKLKKLGLEPYRVDPDGGMYFRGLDFNQVSFRAKSKKRELTEEQKEKRRANLENARKQKQ